MGHSTLTNTITDYINAQHDLQRAYSEPVTPELRRLAQQVRMDVERLSELVAACNR